MPLSTGGDKSTRQSSGAKSYLRSKLSGRKDADTNSKYEPSIYDASTNGSFVSRHSRNESVASINGDGEQPGGGINMNAGVMTAIPYEAAPESRQPSSEYALRETTSRATSTRHRLSSVSCLQPSDYASNDGQQCGASTPTASCFECHHGFQSTR